MQFFTLTNVRKRAGLSQVALSQRAGVSNVAISRIESGYSTPAPETREKIEREIGAVDWINTRPIPFANGEATVYEAENALFKGFKKVASLPVEERLRVLATLTYFFDRFIAVHHMKAKNELRHSGMDIKEEEKRLMRELQRSLSYEASNNS